MNPKSLLIRIFDALRSVLSVGTFFAVVLLTSCAAPELPPPPPTSSPIPYLAQPYPWADTLVKYMSLEDKIGQLMVIDGGSETDTAAQRIAEKTLRYYRVGGMMFRGENQEALSRQLNYFHGISVYPVWFGIRGGILPSDPAGLMEWGAVADDSLLYAYGNSTAQWYRDMGISLDLSLPVSVNYDGVPQRPALHDQVDSVKQKSGNLLSGLLAGKLLACPTPLALPASSQSDTSGLPTQDSRSVWQLEQGELAAIGALLPQGLPGIGLQHNGYPKIDSSVEIPTISGDLTEHYLRKGIQYKGLVFSPPLDDSVVISRYANGQAAVEALQHGADVLLYPRDPSAAFSAIQSAIKKKEIPQATLDAKVKKILQAKAWAGLDCWQPGFEPIAESAMPTNQALERALTRSSLTLVRNEKDRLPLGPVMDLKIVTLSIGTETRTPFQKRLERYQDLNHQQWKTLPDSAIAAARMKKLGWYKYVIIGLHEEQEAGELPDWFVSQLETLDQQSRVVFVNFAHPGHLKGLDSLTCVAQAYGNGEYTQDVAAQMVYGGATASGKLPVQVSDSFPSGHGWTQTSTSRLGFGIPEDAGLPSEDIAKIDSIANYSVRMGVFPGCQVAVAKNGLLVYNRSFGHHTYDRHHRVRRTDLYDMASLTKVCATTLAVMRTYDQTEDFKLGDPLKDHLPKVDTSTVEDIVIEDMLLHRSGLSAGLPIYQFMTFVDSVDSIKSILYTSTKDSLHNTEIAKNFYFADAYRDSLVERIKKMKLVNKGHYVYSDLGFFLLKEMLEAVHEKQLNQYMYQEFYHPLGLRTTGYNPLKHYKDDRLIPTERDRYWRKQTVHGYVHDPAAAMLGGISGHAGLFSNAEDLAVLMQMMLQKGKYGGKRYIEKKTVELFTQRHPESHRGLGWDRPNHGSSKKGLCVKDASPATFGHTGFTGTCIWVDPEHDLVYIFLSNRVHPNAKNQKINGMSVRQSIQQVIYDAMKVKGMGTSAEPPAPEPDSTATQPTAAPVS